MSCLEMAETDRAGWLDFKLNWQNLKVNVVWHLQVMFETWSVCNILAKP